MKFSFILGKNKNIFSSFTLILCFLISSFQSSAQGIKWANDGNSYYRFIKNDYKIKKYNWVERRASDKLRFLLLVLSSLSILPSLFTSLIQVFKTGKFFWLLHPFYVFYISLEYIIISLFNIKNLSGSLSFSGSFNNSISFFSGRILSLFER